MIKDPQELENSKLVISKVIELTLLMSMYGVDFSDLPLDREDRILLNQFDNPDYNQDVDPHYFQKGLRAIRRIRKIFDRYVEKMEL